MKVTNGQRDALPHRLVFGLAVEIDDALAISVELHHALMAEIASERLTKHISAGLLGSEDPAKLIDENLVASCMAEITLERAAPRQNTLIADFRLRSIVVVRLAIHLVSNPRVSCVWKMPRRIIAATV